MTRAIVVSIDGFASFYWTDPRVKIPTLRGLAERGVVADGMETVFPSTTWPTHVSIVTGVRPIVHGVVGNGIVNRDTRAREDLTGDPVYDASRIIKAPTVYDRAASRGLAVAAIDWPATRNAGSIRFNLPFFKDQRVFESQTARHVWEELSALGYPVERQGEWAQLPKRFLKDAMVADLAAHVVRRHTPDVLLVHFLCTDSFQHLYGPRSPEAFWAIEYVDGLLGRFLGSLPAGALDDQTALFVVSDHGFLPVEHEIRINVALRRLGVLQVDGSALTGDARFAMNAGAGYVYALGGDRPRLAADLSRELIKIEGVKTVWSVDRYRELGLPTPNENPLVGDLALEAQRGYYFVDEAQGDEVIAPPHYRGTHGYLPTEPENRAFFLAAGAGIARGKTLGPILSRDVAPTIAQTLGFEMPDVEGRTLAEAFA